MNTLRLENINLHAPYRVMQDLRDITTSTLSARVVHRDRFIIEKAEGKMDGQMNFLAIISRKDNPMLPIVLEEFNETVSFLFDPQEE